jgi:predicted NBD/HSP70 family sugar kinase
MNTTEKQQSEWREYLSPLQLTLLAINAVCFGGCLVLLAIGAGDGPLVLLTIGTGLAFGAGLAGAIVAGRKNAACRRNGHDTSPAQGADR